MLAGWFSNHFYRATLLCKCGLSCRPVSVCPSVRHVGRLYPDGWRFRKTSFPVQ